MTVIALVTGANRGIGKELGRQLANLSYLNLLSSRDLAKAETAVADIGLEIIRPVQLNVTDEARVNRLGGDPG